MSNTRNASDEVHEHTELVPPENPMPTEETVSETTPEEAAVESAPDEALEETPRVAATDAQLEQAQRRMQSAEERALRLQAEMDNLRKRTLREVENAHKFGTEKLLSELLPVVDSLELGLGAAEGDKSEVVAMREGMELTLKMLRAALEKFGIEVIDPAGQPFDPESHQAISMQPGTGAPSNTVLTVVQKGYRLNGRLLRPAMVVVAS